MQHMGSVSYCFTNSVLGLPHYCSPEIPGNISPGADSCSRRGAATHVALQVLRGSGSRSAKIPSCCNETGGWRDFFWIPAGSTWDRNFSKHVPSHLVLQCVLDIGSFCNCTDLGTLKSLKIASYFWYDQPRKQPLDKSSNLQPSRETENAIPRDKSR